MTAENFAVVLTERKCPDQLATTWKLRFLFTIKTKTPRTRDGDRGVDQQNSLSRGLRQGCVTDAACMLTQTTTETQRKPEEHCHDAQVL